MRSESGSGSLLAVAIIGALLLLAALMVPMQWALVTKQQLRGAADAAALAAADVAAGLAGGVPCEIADQVAAANGSRVVACELDGLVATVQVGVTILGITATATATAGPPPRAMN